MARSLSVAEHAAAWAQKGYALSRLGRYEDAAAALAEAVRSSPDDAGLRLERGHAFARLERHDEALDCFDQALARKPEDADSWFLKAETLEALGRDAEALTAWDQYLRRHDDRRLSFFVGLASGLRAELRRAGVLARLGRRDDALTAYRAAFEKGADQLVRPIASVFHDALRDVEEARAAYAERLESRRDDPNTWRGAGQAFLYAKRSQESLEAYDAMIRLVPNEPDAWYGKAEALVQAGRVSEAIAAYEQALRIRPATSQRRSACASSPTGPASPSRSPLLCVCLPSSGRRSARTHATGSSATSTRRSSSGKAIRRASSSGSAALPRRSARARKPAGRRCSLRTAIAGTRRRRERKPGGVESRTSRPSMAPDTRTVFGPVATR